VVEPLVSAPRVLLVIEATRDARAIDATLRRAGWQPCRTRVTTIEELTSVLREGRCQAVVVDCRRRRLDVLDAIAAVLDYDVDLPVIAVSDVFDNLAVETMRAGAVDYLLLDDVRRLPAALATELGKADERRELHRAHEELSTSEARFRTLARATNQIV
jgi:DNA-binding NtrC family response regulator